MIWARRHSKPEPGPIEPRCYGYCLQLDCVDCWPNGPPDPQQLVCARRSRSHPLRASFPLAPRWAIGLHPAWKDARDPHQTPEDAPGEEIVSTMAGGSLKHG